MQTLTKLSNNTTMKMGLIGDACTKCGGHNVFRNLVYDRYGKTIEEECMNCGNVNKEYGIKRHYGQLTLRW